jgi:hypothetical protein
MPSVPSGAPLVAAAAARTSQLRKEVRGCDPWALSTTGHPAASADAVSPPATEKAKGKLLDPNTLLSYTGRGRSLFLVGSAPDTATLAGQPVARIRITGYALSSFLAAFSGIIIVGFYAQASATMGSEYLLGSVAAVLVGGASIAGGRGSMIGTLGGALVLGQVATLVAVANLGSNIQQLIYGVIVLIVIGLYTRRGRD